MPTMEGGAPRNGGKKKSCNGKHDMKNKGRPWIVGNRRMRLKVCQSCELRRFVYEEEVNA